MHFCLSFAVILLHHPIVNGDTMLEHIGPDPDTSINKLVECQGDCDSNSDCSQDLHLACFQRNDGGSSPPGCGGIPFGAYDYCYDIRPPIENIGIDPDTSVNKLEVCQGDCDNDADCAGILTCLDNEYGPPDCSGSPTNQWQYCSNPGRVYQNLGVDPDTSINKLVECQGDCDSNSDCAQNLACFQRNDGGSGPPGCSGSPLKDYDYCYDIRPPIENIGIDPDTSVNKLEVCQGDCDNDADCAGILACLDNKNGPPDCSGSPTNQWQYCSNPRPVYQNLGVDPDTSINKLIDCQGDCDSDNDCIGHLACFQRNGDESGPCSGSPLKDYDYCYDPNTKTPTSTPTGEPSVSVPPTPKPSTKTPTSTPTDVPSDLPTPNGNVCDGLNKKKCKVTNMCSYGKNKISGACEAKKSKYEHDCAQYQTSDMCLNGAHAGLCDYVDDVCTHVCYGLNKKNCKKLKHITDTNKMCKSSKIANPCKGCHLSTKCG